MRKNDKIVNNEALHLYEKYLIPLATLHDCIGFKPLPVDFKRDQFIVAPNIITALLAIAYGQNQFIPKSHRTILPREQKFTNLPSQYLRLCLQDNKNLFENLINTYGRYKKFRECHLKNRLSLLPMDVENLLKDIKNFDPRIDLVLTADNFIEFKTFFYALNKNQGFFNSGIFAPSSVIALRQNISSGKIYTLEQVINFAQCEKNGPITKLLNQLGILIPAAKAEVLFLLKQNNFLLPDLHSIVVDYLYRPSAS